MSKRDGVYRAKLSSVEMVRIEDEDEDADESTEVTRLHELMEKRMAKSSERLQSIVHKSNVLKRNFRRSGSVPAMAAVNAAARDDD